MPQHSRFLRGGVLAASAALLLSAMPANAASSHAPVNRNLVGGKPADGSVVTLVTGDRVLVTKDSAGHRAASVLPGKDADPNGYTIRTFGNEIYVIPVGALPLIKAGRIDRRLFDVAGLVDQGYDDQHGKTLPLIATYGGALMRSRLAPTPLAGSTISLTLPSVDAVALKAEKQKLPQLWADLIDDKGPKVEKLWLDGKVKLDMAESNAQIGTPQAWAAGFDGTGAKVAILDTGADMTHPDLQGQIIGGKNFTDGDENNYADDTIEQGGGHGTHVASTVAGTGAASGGAEKGVAPGADLLIGKVLQYGSGYDSWILAGMAWAVEQGADVVNMSLGGRVGGDCNDEFSIAAQQLTEQTGTLFVMAAGNSGEYGLRTVGSPGCIKGALTVAAVDSADATAYFSSRGPVPGRADVKPEISAPGVKTLAASAYYGAGDPYIRMSGTSMASPHIAGVAALVAAQHPDWTAQQIKAAIVSTATPGATDHVFAQGAGVVDAALVTKATVFGPGAVEAGSFAWPHAGQAPVTTDVTLTNTGATAKTFALSLESLTGGNSAPLAAATVTLPGASVTVPAHGTAKVPFVVNPSVTQDRLNYGTSGGRLVAKAADGSSVVAPFGFYLAPHEVAVTIKTIDRRGLAPSWGSSVDIVDMVSNKAYRYEDLSTDIAVNLPEGRYSISVFIASRDAGTTGDEGLVKSIAYLGNPQFELKTTDDAVTLNYDARKTQRQHVLGEKPMEAQGFYVNSVRTWDNWVFEDGYRASEYADEVYTAPSWPVSVGDFKFGSAYRMYAPKLKMSVAGGNTIEPEYVSGYLNTQTPLPKLEGAGSAKVVFAGGGSRAELAAAKASGKVVLVHLTDGNITEIQENAAALGAKAVLLGSDNNGRWIGIGIGPIPALTITKAEEALLRKGQKTLNWVGTPDSSYVYNLSFVDKRWISPIPLKLVLDRNLAKVSEKFYAQRDQGVLFDGVNLLDPEIGLRASPGYNRIRAPWQRTAYYTAGPTWQSVVSGPGIFSESLVEIPRVYAKGETRSIEWYKAPLRTGPTRRVDGSEERLSERQGNQIGAAITLWNSGDPDRWGEANFGDYFDTELFADGESLGATGWVGGVWDVPAGTHDFRLRTMGARFDAGPPFHVGWNMFYGTETNNYFRSATPGDNDLHVLPILLPTYAVDVDMANLAPVSNSYQVRFGARGQRDYTAGKLTGGKAWVSFDDGGTWQEVPVAADGSGFVAMVDQSAAAGGYVSLKVEMSDSNGAKVDQTIIRAYGVK